MPTGLHAGVAQHLHRRRRGVEVAVAGEPGRAGVVAGRPAERVGEAGALGQALGRGHRRAHPLARRLDQAGADRDVGRQAGRGQLRDHDRLRRDLGQRFQVVGLVQDAEGLLDVFAVGVGVGGADAGVTQQAAAQLLHAAVVVDAGQDATRLRGSSGRRRPRRRRGAARPATARCSPQPSPLRSRREEPEMHAWSLRDQSFLRIRGPRCSKPLAR